MGKKAQGCPVPETIPRALACAITNARPQCVQWQSPGGCKKGRFCRQRHQNDVLERDMHQVRLPFTSRDMSGRLTMRPPLTEGLSYYFRDRNLPVMLSRGRPLATASRQDKTVWAFDLNHMALPDSAACAAASMSGKAKTASGRLCHASGAAFSNILTHGTSIDNAFSIMAAGRTLGGPGICGVGLYCFQTASTSDEEQLINIGVKVYYCLVVLGEEPGHLDSLL